ncbi:Structural maintenance of chromosomes protein 4 [Frankliniella fusca]|uniref:Structural maintenance of chromosomes protein 4 n=1 Tax=Frankliniella fusca TaxID=407009 RepID=A0AAE1LDY2_9NEOP|nr:Structural maintenance of chromosomes protein 4 [Frankliniella fusca]
MKFLAFVVVLCGLQAAQAVPILGDDNALDILDKEVTEWSPAAGSLELLAQQRKQGQLARQLFDLQGVLRAIQNVITAVNDQIQKATNDFLDGVNKAVQDAQSSASQAVQQWNDRLQAVIDGADAFDSSLRDCQSQYRTLQEVSQSLNEDVRQCVLNATESARTSLRQLDALGPQGQELVDAAVAAARECQQQPVLVKPVCFGNGLAGLAVRGAVLGAQATRLGAQVAGELVVKVPLENAACVGAAVDARNQEAAGIIAGVAQCVQDSLAAQSTTTTPAPAGNLNK